MLRHVPAVLIGTLALAAIACADGLRRRTPVPPPTPSNDYTREQLEAIPAPANERYYLIVFGSQSTPKLPRFTHTWATAIKATWTEGQPEPTLELHTISWMPATLRIRTLNRHPEPGVNLELYETIANMQANSERIAMWGPFALRTAGYRRFLIQKDFMDSHAIGYQCVDNRGEAARCGNACDCIHAITDMDPEFDRTRYPLRWYGEAGSRNIVEQVMRRNVVLDGGQTQDWLIPRLGLDCAGIVRRCYNGPVGDLDRPTISPTVDPRVIPVAVAIVRGFQFDNRRILIHLHPDEWNRTAHFEN